MVRIIWSCRAMTVLVPQIGRKFLQTAITSILVSTLSSAQVHAGGGISCASKDGMAEIGISLMGRSPTYAPTYASARLGDKRWSSSPQDGEIELGESQGTIGKNTLAANFADADTTKIIISLQVDYSSEEHEDGFPGTLMFEDGVSRQVFCSLE